MPAPVRSALKPAHRPQPVSCATCTHVLLRHVHNSPSPETPGLMVHEHFCATCQCQSVLWLNAFILAFSFLPFPASGFQITFVKFAWYWLITFLTLVLFTAYGAAFIDAIPAPSCLRRSMLRRPMPATTAGPSLQIPASRHLNQHFQPRKPSFVTDYDHHVPALQV